MCDSLPGLHRGVSNMGDIGNPSAAFGPALPAAGLVEPLAIAAETGLGGHLTGELFHNLFNLTNDGVLLVDDEGRFVDVNPSFCRMARTTREQLIGARFIDFVPPGRTVSELNTADAGAIDFPLQFADGSAIELEWTSRTPLPPGLSLYICRDKAESQRAQAALVESEERQRRAVQAAGSACGSGISQQIGSRGPITSTNCMALSAERLTGQWKHSPPSSIRGIRSPYPPPCKSR